MDCVLATWQGSCNDLVLQDELVAHIEGLAAFSSAATPSMRPIRRHRGIVKGPVLLEPGLLPPGDPHIGADGFGRLPAVRMHGVTLAAPAASVGDVLDIAFLRHPGIAAIDGLMVRVVAGEELQRCEGHAAKGAHCLIRTPSAALDPGLQRWTDILMTWIKTFFVADLDYRRREKRLHGTDRRFAPGDRASRATYWRLLTQSYLSAAMPGDETALAAAVRAGGLPWGWLAGRCLAQRDAVHLSRAVRLAMPQQAWPDLRHAAAACVIQGGHGGDLDYLPFDFSGEPFALSSRRTPQGLVVSVDRAPPVSPRHIVASRGAAGAHARPARSFGAR